MIRIFYSILVCLGLLAASPVLVPLVLFVPKRRKTIGPRLGLMPVPARQAPGRAIWLHALSVGESLSAEAMVHAVKARYPETPLVVSASTRTGFGIASARYGQCVEGVVYFPYDLLFSIRRVADRVNPAVVVLVETDLWPGFLLEMARRRVPVVLVNARISGRSFRRFRRFRGLAGPIFSTLGGVCAQSAADAGRFLRLGVGADRMAVTGNLKFDRAVPGLPSGEDPILERIEAGLAGKSVIVAGSTHGGEDEIVLDAVFPSASSRPPRVLVLAPRHPERADAVVQCCRGRGLAAERLSDLASGEIPEVVVVDRMGVLAGLYRLADVAVVGGGFIPRGGHNPLEPAVLGKPVLFGPDMSDFREIASLLRESGGARRVEGAGELAEALDRWLSDPAAAARAGARALAVVEAHRGAVDRTMAALARFCRDVPEIRERP